MGCESSRRAEASVRRKGTKAEGPGRVVKWSRASVAPWKRVWPLQVWKQARTRLLEMGVRAAEQRSGLGPTRDRLAKRALGYWMVRQRSVMGAVEKISSRTFVCWPAHAATAPSWTATQRVWV